MSAPPTSSTAAPAARSDRAQQLRAAWQRRSVLTAALLPFALLFGAIAALRRSGYRHGWLKAEAVARPLLIVGNLTVGGTGKTPTVIALARALQAAGHRPGILSRGYRARVDAPQRVTPDADAADVGDEPLLIAQALAPLQIPVCVYPRRVDAARALLAANPDVTVLICDDGLQHYRLARHPYRDGGPDVELVLEDSRGVGNGWLLPAGPLRELPSRGRDLTLVNTATPIAADPTQRRWPIVMAPGDLWQLAAPDHHRPLAALAGHRITAVCGIGAPQRFFAMLRAHGLVVDERPLPDHADFGTDPFADLPADATILITEKDAVKCRSIAAYRADPRIWVVPLTATLAPDCVAALLAMLPPPGPLSLSPAKEY